MEVLLLLHVFDLLASLLLTVGNEDEEMVAVATPDEASGSYDSVPSATMKTQGRKRDSLIAETVSAEKGCLQRGHSGFPPWSLPLEPFPFLVFFPFPFRVSELKCLISHLY